MAMRTTVRLPEELLSRAKRKAAAEGRTLTSLIEDGLRAVIAEAPKSAKEDRPLPRVSKATGGLNPGFGSMTFSELEEIDDLDYIERLKNGFM